MLPSNFVNTASENPELKPVLQEIARWIETHPGWESLDPEILAVDLREINGLELAKALGALVAAGSFRLVYKVRTPSGVMSVDDFADPLDIPEEVVDRWNHPFDTSDADVIPILKASTSVPRPQRGMACER